MEIAYKVKQNSDYYQHAIDYFNFAKQEREFVREFVESHQGLNCDFYAVRVTGHLNALITKENVNDLEFAVEVEEERLADDILVQFKKPDRNDLRILKKNSKLMKEFRQLALERGLVANVRMFSPIAFYDLCHWDRYSWSRFLNAKGELFIKIKMSNAQFHFSHDDFENIKLSEYYQKLEEFKGEQSK